MKKLISAAAALAMAASMVGSAVPFATGAADATKGFSMAVYKNPDGSAASTSIDTANGDVSVPIAIYLSEGTADMEGFTCKWTISSDTTTDLGKIKFKMHKPGTEYFKSAVTWSTNNGTKTYDSTMLIGFAGTVVYDEDDGLMFKDTSSNNQYVVDDKQTTENCDYAFGGLAWLAPSKGYTWTGSKSDTNPVCVFDVVFPAGTAAGTYSIDFLNNPRPDNPDNKSTMIQTADTKYTKGNGLELGEGIKITVGGGGTVTTPPAVTTQAPATTQAPSTTTTPSTPSTGSSRFSVAPKEQNITGVAAGEEVSVKFYPTTADGLTAVIFNADIDTDLEYDITASCKACEGGKFYERVDDSCDIWTVAVNNDDGDAVSVDDSKAILTVNVKIPDNAKDGDTFKVNLKSFHVVETAFKPIVEYDADVKGATITVGSGQQATDPTQPPTTQAPTTQAPVTQPTTTQAPVTQPPVGNANYGDTNCDGKVNIADVVVLNKWLNDAKSYNMTEQGKVNADCCDAQGGAGLNSNDSDAIIKSIVHLVTLPCSAADLSN